MFRTVLLFSLIFVLQLHAQEPMQGQPAEQVQPVQVQPVQVQPVQVQPVQVQPVQVQPVQVQPVQVQPIQPEPVQAQPQAQPVQVQAQPVQVQAQPVQVQAQPVQVQAQPVQVQAQPVQVQAQPVQAQPVQVQPVQVQPEIKSSPVIVPDEALLGTWIVDQEEVQALDTFKALSKEQQEEVIALLAPISLEWSLSTVKAKIDESNESVGSYEIISKTDGLYVIQTKLKNVTETIEFQINQNKANLNPKTKILPLKKKL